MDINEIIRVMTAKAEDIAIQEIAKYSKDRPEILLTDDIRTAVKERSVSHLTLQLSKFHFKEGQELDEQFNTWFETNEETDLRNTCRHCIEDEVKKMLESNGKEMSSLDKYLKAHLGDAHTID